MTDSPMPSELVTRLRTGHQLLVNFENLTSSLAPNVTEDSDDLDAWLADLKMGIGHFVIEGEGTHLKLLRDFSEDGEKVDESRSFREILPSCPDEYSALLCAYRGFMKVSPDYDHYLDEAGIMYTFNEVVGGPVTGRPGALIEKREWILEESFYEPEPEFKESIREAYKDSPESPFIDVAGHEVVPQYLSKPIGEASVVIEPSELAYLSHLVLNASVANDPPRRRAKFH